MPDMMKLVDLSFRPDSYVSNLGPIGDVLWSIKGEERRDRVADYFNSERPVPCPPDWLKPSLPNALRHQTIMRDPWFAAGEYLPDRTGDEIEIARLVIEAPGRHVIAAYAEFKLGRWHVRLVDEFEGKMLTGPMTLTSKQPLSRGELVDFFLDGLAEGEGLHDSVATRAWSQDLSPDLIKASSRFDPLFDRALKQQIVCRRMPPQEQATGYRPAAE